MMMTLTREKLSNHKSKSEKCSILIKLRVTKKRRRGRSPNGKTYAVEKIKTHTNTRTRTHRHKCILSQMYYHYDSTKKDGMMAQMWHTEKERFKFSINFLLFFYLGVYGIIPPSPPSFQKPSWTSNTMLRTEKQWQKSGRMNVAQRIILRLFISHPFVSDCLSVSLFNYIFYLLHAYVSAIYFDRYEKKCPHSRSNDVNHTVARSILI